VWARGIDGRAIFLEEGDRLDLLERLSELLPEEGARCFAWAFMCNHVHFFLKTGETPLSKVMRRLNTGFALCFNRRHRRQGYLFQGRFGSRTVHDEAGVLTVMRYVLRNPLEAGIVPDLVALERFPWCGYGALVGARTALPFEAVQDALAAFGSDVPTARSRLRSWMATPVGAPAAEEPTDAVPLDALVGDVCREVGVLERDFRDGCRSRSVSLARTIVCRRAVLELGLRSVAVARELGLSESAVSQALRRGTAAASEDGGPSPS
jgi:REP element-mobilizing transposase RayT